MRKTAKTCILIILSFLTTLLLAVGFSTWIILSETTKLPTLFQPVETEIDTTDVPTLTTIYAGNEATLTSSITNGVKVKAGETDLTDKGIFNIELDYSNVYNAYWDKTDTEKTQLTANVKVSFSVKEQYKYVYAEPDIAEISIPLNPVAYCGNVYYSTVDYAITNTTSGKIVVIPTRDYTLETSDSTDSLQTPKIAKTVKTNEIRQGVTLSLPYTESTIVDYYNSSNNYGTNYILGIAKDTSASYTNSDNKSVTYYPATERSTSAYRNNPTKYLKNNITIASGHTLTNNGAIEVGGVISGGNGGQALNCYTIVDYAQITLQSSAKILSNGTITNYGFIVSDGTYTGEQKPQLLLEEGTLTAPFTLVEHRGGTIFAGVFMDGGGSLLGGTSNPKGLPFNRFYMENTIVETKISSSAKINSYVNLWANGGSNEDSFLLISNTNDAFIQLGNDSYIISNFSSTEVKNYLDFYGDVTLNYMQLSILGKNISSSNSHFPISNHYSITLNKIPESTKNAQVKFNQKIKIMQGGSLTVNPGADLISNEIIVYTTNCFDKTAANAAGYQYPAELADGVFIVNGSLTTSNNVGGLIQTKVNHANIKLSGSNSLTSYELSSGSYNYISGSATYVPVAKTLSLPLTNGTNSSTATSYYSLKKADGTYAWYSVDFKVVFDAQGGTGGQTINVKDEIDDNLGTNGGYIVTLPTATPTRTHYTFSHWCTNKNCTNGTTCTNKFANKTVVFEETTIYAIWTANTYTIQYNITFDDGITPITKDNETFSATNPLTPTLPTIDGKNFFGWYADSAMTKPITTISTALIDNGTLTADSNNVITVYGKFVNNYKVTFYVNNREIENKFGSDTYHHDDNAKPDEAYTNVPNATGYDTDKEVTVYFAGWNTKADGSGTVWTPDMPITENIQLYAQWTKKHVLSFNTTTNNGNVQVTAPVDVYLITGQSHDLSEYTETLTANDTDMTKTKYFGGWYNGETPVTSISINGNTTITAKWLDKTKIEFLKGEQNAFENETYYLFDDQEISTSTLIQNNITAFNASTQNTKIFDGWSDGTTTYAEIIVTANSDANTTFTAQWKAKPEINFVDTEGVFVNETHYPNEDQTPFATPTAIQENITAQNNDTRKKRYFVGWSIDGGTTIYSANIEVSYSESVTFTAVWGDKHLVTVQDVIENNEKATKEYYIIPNQTFELSTDLVTAINNYSASTDTEQYFLGWNDATDKDATITITSVTENKTYTANWQTKYVVKVVGLVENGTNNATKIYNIIPGEPFELSSDLVTAITDYSDSEKKEHYFLGWNGATDEVATITIDEVNAGATYTANWGTKVNVKVIYDGANNLTDLNEYYRPSTSYTVPSNPSKTGYTFNSWTVTGGEIVDGTISLPATDGAVVTLTATYDIRYITVNVTVNNDSYLDTSNTYVKVGNRTLTSGDTVTVEDGTIKVTATANSSGKTPTVKINEKQTTEHIISGGESEINIVITGNKKSCFAGGTLITLADGTQKPIEQITENDYILVFDHVSGQYVVSGILFYENSGDTYYDIINLEFSNGQKTRIIYEHGLFDLTLNKYVYITESNYAEFIGHEFALMNTELGYERVTLEKAYITNEFTGCYSITSFAFNYFIDGLFSMPGAIDGLFNIFEYGEGLKYDEEKMQADIKKYGLFTYEDFKELVPIEVYEAVADAKYFKVAVGKGLITWEEIVEIIQMYLTFE